MPRKISTHLSFTLFTTTAALAVLGFSDPASACSCAAEVLFYASTPADGSDEVPTDAKLFVQVGLGSAVTLFDEENNEVTTTQNYVSSFGGFCSSNLEIVPAASLLPHHTYRLVAFSDAEEGFETDDSDSVTFTTGDGPAEVQEVPAPNVKLAVFATPHTDSCTEYPLQACLSAEDGQTLEMRAEHDGAARRYVETSRAMNYIPLGDLKGEVCLTVHSRDVAGNLSAPFEHCFDRDDVYELSGDDDDTIYSPCESDEVKALLNGEIPSPKDAGPTSSPTATDAGPMNDADSGIDAGTKGPIDTEEVDPTDSTHATSDHEQNAVDAAPQDNASSSALDAGDEEREVEKPPVAAESDDSGCSVVAVGSHGTTTSLGLLITALASVFFRRRRIGEREAFAGRGFSRRR